MMRHWPICMLWRVNCEAMRSPLMWSAGKRPGGWVFIWFSKCLTGRVEEPFIWGGRGMFWAGPGHVVGSSDVIIICPVIGSLSTFGVCSLLNSWQKVFTVSCWALHTVFELAFFILPCNGLSNVVLMFQQLIWQLVKVKQWLLQPTGSQPMCPDPYANSKQVWGITAFSGRSQKWWAIL